jgi:adenylate cyclase
VSIRPLLVVWEALLGLSIALAMLAGLLLVGDRGVPLRLEGETLDLRFRLRPQHPPVAPIVIIAIDDASIAELGRWPWSRKLFAQLLGRVAAARPKVVCFDLLFTEPQRSPVETERAAIEPLLQGLEPADRRRIEGLVSALAGASDADTDFARAIEQDGTVILPFALDLRPNGVMGEPSAALPAELEKAAYARVRGAVPDRLPEAAGLRLPVAPLAQSSLLAHITTVPDYSGTRRWDYPVLRYGGAYFPSLSLEAVRAFLGIPRSDVVVDLGLGIDLGPLYVPTDDGMRLLVNYYPPGTFQRVGFADALSGHVPPETFAGKIVLIGAAAAGLGDIVATPYTPSLPGIERHATLMANLLERDFLWRDDGAVALDALLILSSGLAVGLAARWGTIAAALAGGVLLGGLALLDFTAFVRFGVWLNFLLPSATIVSTVGAILGVKYAVERRRERRIRSTFARYLHPDLVDELCRSAIPPQLGGEERELTVLFTDIRDFTTVAEQLTPSVLVALMNEFFSAMTDIVLAQRGMLDKYVGDSLMAVFGAPLPDPDHAQHACRAALGMQAALGSLRTRWRAEGRPCLEMRIGINTGHMVIGNMGTERHFDYTVMGDEVNVASRLEAANKTLGTEILISASTYRQLGADGTVRPCGAIEVKGRAQPVEAFELLALTGREDTGGQAVASPATL